MARKTSGRSRSPRAISTYPSADLTIAGQRRAVWEGRALKTRGGLSRDDLKVSKSTGKIVSKRASRASKRSFERNGLRPDKNIARKSAHFRGAQDDAEPSNADDGIMRLEQLDWEALLSDQ